MLSQYLNICNGQQTVEPDRFRIIKNMADNVKDLFYSSNCSFGSFANGRLYSDYYPNLMGHQYLVSRVWENGTVYFKDAVQMELLINYDIVSDKLLLNKFYSDGVYCIELNINDIEGFSFMGHEFIKMDISEGSRQVKGYFEVLHDGKAQLLIKWEKYISKSSNPGKDFTYLKKTFYIVNNNELIKINNRKSIIYALSDKAVNIEDYIKQNKFYVRTAEQDDFIELLQFYDSL